MKPWRYNDTDIKDVREDSIASIVKRIISKPFANAYDKHREQSKANNEVPLAPEEFFKKLTERKETTEK